MPVAKPAVNIRGEVRMRSSLHIKTRVLPGHRIEFSSPELRDGESVEVLVMPSVAETSQPLASDRVRLLHMTMEHRRRALSDQANGLEREYAPDDEREAWQGGEIIE